MGLVGGNRAVALARVVCPVCAHCPKVVTWRYLIKQLGQHWRVSDVACDTFNGAHFQRFLVEAYAFSTPNVSLGATMLAGIPFSFALGFDAGDVDQQMQRAASHHDTEGSRSAFFDGGTVY